MFRGSLWAKTPYKGTPTEELDKHWERLTSTFLIDIPDSALAQLNKSATAAVRLPKDTPGGVGGRVFGAVDVFHQLHCLNRVCQSRRLT